MSWDRIARGRQKAFYCVCNPWTTPWHHVLSLHCSRSSLTWSPTVHRKTWTNTQQGFAWHPVTAVSPNLKLSHLRRRVKHSTEWASPPDAEHLQVLVPPKQAEDVQHLVSHWRLCTLSLVKIPFIFSCRDCAGSIKPLLLWHWAAMRVQRFCGSRYWSPLIWSGKSCLPISTAKPESVSYMRHPLVFYLIISITLQYENFSIQPLCVGGCECFQLIVTNALAQAVAAGIGLQAPLPKPGSNISLHLSANAINSALHVWHGEMTQAEWQNSTQKTLAFIFALLHTRN